MNTIEAQQMAEEQIAIHCPDYSFDFIHAKRRFGQCNYNKKIISLSKPLVELNEPDAIMNTILHEIAHALVGIGNGHNWKWKRMARKIGAKPERCCSEDVLKIKGKYVYRCVNCNKEMTMHRKSKSRSACIDCCRVFNGGRFSDKYLFVFVREDAE